MVRPCENKDGSSHLLISIRALFLNGKQRSLTEDLRKPTLVFPNDLFILAYGGKSALVFKNKLT